MSNRHPKSESTTVGTDPSESIAPGSTSSQEVSLARRISAFGVVGIAGFITAGNYVTEDTVVQHSYAVQAQFGDVQPGPCEQPKKSASHEAWQAAAATCIGAYADSKFAVINYGVSDKLAADTVAETRVGIHTLFSNTLKKAQFKTYPASPEAKRHYDRLNKDCGQQSDASRFASTIADRLMPEAQDAHYVVALVPKTPCKSGYKGVTDGTRGHTDLYATNDPSNTAKLIAARATHEIGHMFGLGHESGISNIISARPSELLNVTDFLKTVTYSEYAKPAMSVMGDAADVTHTTRSPVQAQVLQWPHRTANSDTVDLDHKASAGQPAVIISLNEAQKEHYATVPLEEVIEFKHQDGISTFDRVAIIPKPAYTYKNGKAVLIMQDAGIMITDDKGHFASLGNIGVPRRKADVQYNLQFGRQIITVTIGDNALATDVRLK